MLLICLALLSGASSWEGKAEPGTRSQFRDDGLFAISSVFPEGRLVDVTALPNGKTYRFLIVGAAASGVSGHFLLLAPQASSALGLMQGSELRVDVRLADTGDSSSLQSGALAETLDPDYNMKLLAAREMKAKEEGAAPGALTTKASPDLGGVFLVEASGKLAVAAAMPGVVASSPSMASRSGIPAQIASPLSASPGYSPPVASGAEKKHYLQIGAFGTAQAMSALMRSFSPFYKMEVRPILHAGKPCYRLLVGPLSVPEMDMARARAREAGVRDAFATDGR
jgi:hypothetical protein